MTSNSSALSAIATTTTRELIALPAEAGKPVQRALTIERSATATTVRVEERLLGSADWVPVVTGRNLSDAAAADLVGQFR